MERPEVIQPIIDLFPAARYLEVGVSQGVTFHALRAGTKVAVDPNFLFQVPASPTADGSHYHSCTSDAFFAQYGKGPKFDVIYLDGLHTYEQTLRDLLNSIVLLNDGGVIIIDDVLPNSYEAGLRDPDECFAIRRKFNNADSAWMGDVYKLVFFVESFIQQFDFRTIADNHGQLVMWRGVRDLSNTTDRLLSEISDYDYSDSVLNRDVFRVQSYREIFDLVKGAR
ncbi:hypothetical protein OPKNFCMD_3043 [Methylobacterium crusticola]|uniref:Class I SAM-dependent methyltransferase n=1 Tax=Methylobacterium crusticola TaxID=1697972 RepID=A0ABQ4QZE8_9HYPH|nr:class I SAM-dependent methyltransferase [Methylobacterium crusticola]GJD50304.1 hypothetical protein OPKNFCMD_3043 [Methylobacterium crusticola]